MWLFVELLVSLFVALFVALFVLVALFVPVELLVSPVVELLVSPVVELLVSPVVLFDGVSSSSPHAATSDVSASAKSVFSLRTPKVELSLSQKKGAPISAPSVSKN